jgi:hypothetical protein
MNVYFLWGDSRPRYPRETGPIPAFPAARYDLGMLGMALSLRGGMQIGKEGPQGRGQTRPSLSLRIFLFPAWWNGASPDHS